MGEDARRVQFRCFRRVWDRHYRLLVPPAWIVDVEQIGRVVTVTLDLRPVDWSTPAAAVLWSSPRVVRFPAPLWSDLFSLIVPLSWIVHVDSSGQRSVTVHLLPRLGAADCLCRQSLAMVAAGASSSRLLGSTAGAA